MVQQSQLMQQMFTKPPEVKEEPDHIGLKTKKLTLFGEHVQPDQIDFCWTVEKECDRLGIDYNLNLQAVRLTSDEDTCLRGIQLIFTDGVKSPVFSANEEKEDQLVKHSITKVRLSHKKITEVIAKVDKDYITEIQFHSAGKEISAFYYQTGVNHQV